MPVEMVLRGTATYWFLLVLFRVAIGRRIGAVGMADILVLVIVSDAFLESDGEISVIRRARAASSS